MNTQLLETVARWLDQPAPDDPGFDMFTSIHVEECGTRCCIAGYVAMLREPGIELDPDVRCTMKSKEVHWGRVSRTAIIALDIPDDLAHELFYGDTSDRHHAARCIRKLIRTGIVDWAGTKAVDSEVPIAELDAVKSAFKAVFEPA